jgi:hypothetical protein
MPLWLSNQSAAAQEINLTVNAPTGWTVGSGGGKFSIAAKQTAATRIEVKLPLFGEHAGSKTDAQEVSVHAECHGQSVGDVKLRVELRKRALPE